jgi:hypothetical protein
VLRTHLQGFHPQKGFSNFTDSTTYQEKPFYARPQQKKLGNKISKNSKQKYDRKRK